MPGRQKPWEGLPAQAFEPIAPHLPASALVVTLRQFERIREGLVANAAPRLAMAVAAIAWPRMPSPE